VENEASQVTIPKGVGGAIAILESVQSEIKNCIFSKNKNTAIAAVQADGYGYSEPAVTYSMFNNNSDCDYVNWLLNSGTGTYYCGADELNSRPLMNDNFDGDPIFVPGRLGSYYLSESQAGQILDKDGNVAATPAGATSPAIDAGSDDAVVLGLSDPYSTRTDNVFDTGPVDIGYHYRDPVPAQNYLLTTHEVPTGTAVITPASGVYKQYAQVLITAVADDDYQFVSWQNTDDDSRVDRDPQTNQLLSTQKNIVTMSSDKNILAFFETIMITLRTRILAGEAGTLTPLYTFGKKLKRAPTTTTKSAGETQLLCSMTPKR
jgi:hypothetical protein